MLSRAFITLAIVAAALAAPVPTGHDVETGHIAKDINVHDITAVVTANPVTKVEHNANGNQINGVAAGDQLNAHGKRTGSVVDTGSIVKDVNVKDVAAIVTVIPVTDVSHNLNGNQVNGVALGDQTNFHRKRTGSIGSLVDTGSIVKDVKVDHVLASVTANPITKVQHNANGNQINGIAGGDQTNLDFSKRTGSVVDTGDIAKDINVEHIVAIVTANPVTKVEHNLNGNQINGIALGDQTNVKGKRDGVHTGNIVKDVNVKDVAAHATVNPATFVEHNVNGNQINGAAVGDAKNIHPKRTLVDTGDIVRNVNVDHIVGTVTASPITHVSDNLNDNQINVLSLGDQTNIKGVHPPAGGDEDCGCDEHPAGGSSSSAAAAAAAAAGPNGSSAASSAAAASGNGSSSSSAAAAAAAAAK